jgi:hypothetical protein
VTGASNNKRGTLFDHKNTNLWSNRVPLVTVAARLRLSSDFEVGFAAFIHPNSVLVASPSAAENAGRFAALADQADVSASAFDAKMDPPVAGLAIEVLNEAVAVTITVTVTVTIAVTVTVTVTVAVIIAVAITITVTVAVIIAVAITITVTVAVIIAVAIIRTGHEIGSAAAIHPDAAPVITPCPPRNTGRIAALTPQADAAARIGAAIVTPPVVRSAKYSFAPLRSRVGKTAADENYRQQGREYAYRVVGECSKLKLIQGHSSPFPVKVRFHLGGVGPENITGGRVFKPSARL